MYCVVLDTDGLAAAECGAGSVGRLPLHGRSRFVYECAAAIKTTVVVNGAEPTGFAPLIIWANTGAVPLKDDSFWPPADDSAISGDPVFPTC